MSEKKLMKGNEAVAEGAIRGGCRYFFGYPITPQNEIPEYMSWRIREVGGDFIQAESSCSRKAKLRQSIWFTARQAQAHAL